jgi:hypothetical protein
MKRRKFLKAAIAIVWVPSLAIAMPVSRPALLAPPDLRALALDLGKAYSESMPQVNDRVEQNIMTQRMARVCMVHGFPVFKVKIDDENNPPSAVNNCDMHAQVTVQHHYGTTVFGFNVSGMIVTHVQT